MVSLNELARELSGLKGRTLITFHSIADLEAVASAVVLSSAVPRSEVRLIDGVNAQTRRVLGVLGLKVLPIEELNYKNIVLVDVSNADLLGRMKEGILGFRGKLIAVDHHYHTKELHGTVYVNRARTSCCEIIYELLKKMKKRIDAGEALLLCAGIVSDTAQFKSANGFTFKAFSALLEKSGRSYQEILELVKNREDVSERIAKLKALQRAKLVRVGDYLVAASEAGSYELGCASALVQEGCDFAFVANAEEGRISGLKREEISFANVGEIMERAGRILKGSGGGHTNVGGARGRPEFVAAALKECTKLVEQEIRAFENRKVGVKEV